MTTTPRLALAYLVASQAQKEVTHNDALNDLDYMTQLAVTSRTIATPPSSPSTGDVYIVAASATGAWASQDLKVAAYYSGWRFKTPKAGCVAWVVAESRYYYYTGSAWALVVVPPLEATLTWTPGTIATASGVTSSSITVTGAALGDFVRVAAPYDCVGLIASGYVSAANTVVIRVHNGTGSSVTLASGVWRVRIEKA